LVWEISTAVVLAETDVNGVVLTSDTPASDPAALDPVDPSIAVLANGDIVTTWVQERIDATNPAGVWQTVFAGGGPGAPILVRDADAAATPAIAVLGNQVASCWTEGSSLMLAFAAPGQTPQTIFQRSFDDPARVHSPNIAAAGVDVVVAYGVSNDELPGLETAGLVLSRVNTSGDAVAEIVITESAVGDTASVAVDRDGRIAAVWQGCNELGDGDGCGIFMSLYDANLDPLRAPIRVNNTTRANQLAPSVAAIDGGFAAVWADFSGLAPDDSPAVRARPIYLDALGL
jgi:hypothetical protein